MDRGPIRLLRRSRPAFGGLGLVLLLAAGCAVDRPAMDRALQSEQGTQARDNGVAEHYCLHCPDLVAVNVQGRPDLNGTQRVGTDGRIDMGDQGRLRVEGRTTPEVVKLIAVVAGEPPSHIQVRLNQFNSQQVYLFGPGVGPQRSVPYRGQETVVDLLQRVGGIAPGAAPNDVYVIRPHVTEALTPEVFHIDLRGILERKDQSTNLRLQPFDEVHVGETRQSSFEKYVPPILRPLYESVCGLSRKIPFADKILHAR